MLINADVQIIVTKEGGEQIIIDNPLSINVTLHIAGNTFNMFKTMDDLVKSGWG